VYAEVSTGARDDLLKATNIAKSMVKAYGMSEKLGQVSFDGERQPLFLQTGRPQTEGEYSEQTSQEIDAEVRRIIDDQYARVMSILRAQQDVLHEAATVLLSKETITGEELRAIVAQVSSRPHSEHATRASVH
jgi:cell division protease FtsH